MDHIPLRYRFRHFIKKIPLAEKIYYFMATVFFPSYTEDGLRAFKNCPFLKDGKFNNAYKKLLQQHPGSKQRWRAHVIQWAGDYAVELDGDFIETGVDRGGYAASLIEYVDFGNIKDKKFYLFDTYEGIPAGLVSPGEEKAAYKNKYTNTYAMVTETFRGFSNVIIVKGIVPDILKTVNIEKVAFLSVDMNCAAPERAALEFFWPKIVKGGIIVLDDYAFPGRELQQKAADGFAASAGVTVLCLPTGQGIIIKP